jgi:hypothetical protein
MNEIEMKYEGVRISEYSIWEIERYCPDYTSYVTIVIVFHIGDSISIGKTQIRYEDRQCVGDDSDEQSETEHDLNSIAIDLDNADPVPSDQLRSLLLTL